MATIGEMTNHLLENQGKLERLKHPLQYVGTLDVKKIRKLLRINFQYGNVYIHKGIVSHVNFHHHLVCDIYLNQISRMLQCPTFVGQNPRESDSIELYVEDSHLLLGIKRNKSSQYLFIATMYVLEDWDRKIRSRMETNRIRRYL